MADAAVPRTVDERAEARWRRELAALGIEGPHLETGIGRIRRAMTAVTGSAQAARLLDPQALEGRSELALTAMIDGAAQSLRIDRTFVDGQGVRWIVDWKTSAHEGGDADAFLDNELERYRGQLERYAARDEAAGAAARAEGRALLPAARRLARALEGSLDREWTAALAVRRAEETQRVENRGTGAGTRRRLARQQITPLGIELDRAAHAQRSAEVANPPVQGLAPDRAFADDEFEVAQRLAAGARSAQAAQEERAACRGRAASDEPDLSRRRVRGPRSSRAASRCPRRRRSARVRAARGRRSRWPKSPERSPETSPPGGLRPTVHDHSRTSRRQGRQDHCRRADRPAFDRERAGPSGPDRAADAAELDARRQALPAGWPAPSRSGTRGMRPRPPR